MAGGYMAGGYMAGGACVAGGGMCGRGECMCRTYGHRSGRYASYWNAFLFKVFSCGEINVYVVCY